MSHRLFLAALAIAALTAACKPPLPEEGDNGQSSAGGAGPGGMGAGGTGAGGTGAGGTGAGGTGAGGTGAAADPGGGPGGAGAGGTGAGGDPAGGGGSGGSAPGSVRAGLPPAGPTGYLEFDGEFVRLTPEQISKHLEEVFGYTQRYTGPHGLPEDHLTTAHGVALGGIDYILASKRDPFPRTQTVLISRMLAWGVAVEVVLNHSDPMRTPKLRVFDLVDIKRDRPDNEGAQRWEAQLDDLYWRMFSRAPTADEARACRNAFLILTDRDGNDPVLAWIAVLYALVSTMEFWVL